MRASLALSLMLIPLLVMLGYMVIWSEPLKALNILVGVTVFMLLLESYGYLFKQMSEQRTE